MAERAQTKNKFSLATILWSLLRKKKENEKNNNQENEIFESVW